MKKRILVLALVALLAISAAFAADAHGTSAKNQFSIGLNLGTNTGVGMKYGMGKFDIQGNVGFYLFDFDPFGIACDVSANYDVYDIKINSQNEICVIVGGGALLRAFVGDDAYFSAIAFGTAGLEYTFPKFPMTLYLKLGYGLGIKTDDGIGFDHAFMGQLGGLYNF